MRKYKYTQLEKPRPDGLHVNTKLYTIYLSPNCRHVFKNERSAQAFAAGYSKDINTTLHLFNMLLVELYTANRAAWFYYFDRATGKNYTHIEAAICSNIKEIEICLDRAAHKSGGTYTAGAIWRNIASAGEAIVLGFGHLAEFLFMRRLYAESEKMKIYASQSAGAIDRLKLKYRIMD